MELSIDGLVAGCADESFDNGLTIRAALEPLGGDGAPVKPAVYAGGTYQQERRWFGDGDDRQIVDALSIDNVPSQANRLEAALERLAPSVGLPQMVLDLSDHPHLPPHVPQRLSAYRFPHRNADAYLRDAELDGVSVLKTDLGKGMFRANAQAPSALVEHMPHALLFGFWQSHMGKNGPQTKLARSWTSEIIGYEPGSTEIRRLGLKGDPLNLTSGDGLAFDPDDLRAWELIEGKVKSGSKSKDSLAEVGHGQVPVSGADAPIGSVSFGAIEQRATVSFASLRNIGTGDPTADAVMRALLCSIGIMAHVAAFGRGFNLRSGADLLPQDVSWKWLGESGSEDVDAPTMDQCRDLFAGCVDQARSVGLPVGGWSGDEVVLRPNKSLLGVIEKTFPEYDL